LETIGNKTAILFPIVSNSSFLNPQGLGKKPCIDFVVPEDCLWEELRAERLIEAAEHVFTRLQKFNLTKAQREDAINYLPGHVVEFHRRAAAGFESGEQWQVIGGQGRKARRPSRTDAARVAPCRRNGIQSPGVTFMRRSR
jgi:hypothetical protein